ncbi:hypothetical protein KP509_23G042200 [Ceratopteris richardii]|nr:hypothetical protein KP509_23G042200 [Ceratopteris richardii]
MHHTENGNADVRDTESSRREDTIEDFVSLPSVLPIAELPLSEHLLQDFNTASNVPEAICNAADTLITQLLSPSQLDPSLDPNVLLVANCAPVGETPPTPCVVKGALPEDLAGVYIRNGPNLAYMHRGDGIHIFDGDGMLHAVNFADGKATFCARYVKTARFQQEAAARRPLFPKFFGGKGLPLAARIAVLGLRTISGLVDVLKGTGLSNTSVCFFNGQVLSLSEDDMPYVIKLTESGDIVTVGMYELPGTRNMCAHPKFDPLTGEMFAFSLTVPFVPFSIFRVSADGVMSPHVPVPLLDLPLVHDFAITRRYVVFPDNQLVIRPLEALQGSALVADASKTSRFCVLPRYALPSEAATKAQWFDTPGCNCLHYINAWDEGDSEIVVVAPVLSPAESILDIPGVNTSCTLTEIRLNRATGKAKSRKLSDGNFEFGTLNQNYVGRKCRYVYLASGCYPEITGVVKVDLEKALSRMDTLDSTDDVVVARRDFGHGRIGGEPYFVPRKQHQRSQRGGTKPAEDEGYLLCFVHDMETGVSEMLVMNAQSPSLEIIATVQLPSRVPAGFHGCFIDQEQLAKQNF